MAYPTIKQRAYLKPRIRIDFSLKAKVHFRDIELSRFFENAMVTNKKQDGGCVVGCYLMLNVYTGWRE